jgi:hypothetical protein
MWLCIDRRSARQQDVNLVKILLLGKKKAQHLAAFWIVIAAKTNAMKKRVNPFTRQVFDQPLIVTSQKLVSMKRAKKPP